MMGRRWDELNARPRTRDALVAVIHLLLGLALLQFGAIRLWSQVAVFHSSGFVFLLTLLGMVAIATQRSTRPFTALALGTPIVVLDVLFGGSLGVMLVCFDLVYCAVKYGSDRGVRIAMWIAAGLAAATGAGLLLRPWGSAVPLLAVQWALIIAVAGMWGWNVRTERLRTRAQLAAQHASATREMRQRIAHDLHDLVSNQIAVAGLHVEAARMRIEQAAIESPEALASLDRAGEGAETAHRQLRRLITVLTTVDDLEEGSAVEAETALEELGALPPGERTLEWRSGARDAVGQAMRGWAPERSAVILRVLRELVANAVKHGRGDITIDAAVTPDLFEATVRNACAGAHPAVPDRGIGVTGAGLLLAGCGGRLESRADPEGDAWCARVTVPQEESPASASGTEQRDTRQRHTMQQPGSRP